MNDNQLHCLLSELPQEKASPGFTEHVLERLEENQQESAKHSYKFFYLAAGLILIAVIGLTIGFKTRQAPSQKQLHEEISQLRNEHKYLTKTLTELREKLGKARPTVYLGGDEHADYVLDLGNIYRVRPARFEDFR